MRSGPGAQGRAEPVRAAAPGSPPGAAPGGCNARSRPGRAGPEAEPGAPPRAGVFTWEQEHVLPGARAVPAVRAARHAARLPPGPSAAPAAAAAAGLSPRSAGPARSAGKWREKGLFRVARRAVGLAGPRRRPAGRSWFRFRSQPAARVNFLNLAPSGGDPSLGAQPSGRGQVAASPLRFCASGKCSARAPRGAGPRRRAGSPRPGAPGRHTQRPSRRGGGATEGPPSESVVEAGAPGRGVGHQNG